MFECNIKCKIFISVCIICIISIILIFMYMYKKNNKELFACDKVIMIRGSEKKDDKQVSMTYLQPRKVGEDCSKPIKLSNSFKDDPNNIEPGAYISQTYKNVVPLVDDDVVGYENSNYLKICPLFNDINISNLTCKELIGDNKPIEIITDPASKKPIIDINGCYTSGFNAKYIVEKSIGKGTIIEITRSGDVIPYIVSIIKPSQKPDMPNILYKWNENGVDIIVEDDDYNTSDIKMISSFFSSMGIKNLNDATVKKIFNNGFDTLLKIFQANTEDFEKIDGFGKKLADKVINNIHNGLKDTTIDVLLGSSGIFGEGMGKRKIKLLFDNIPDLMDIYSDMSNEELRTMINQLDGFSDKTTDKTNELILALWSRGRIDGSQSEGPRFDPHIRQKLFTIS